MTLHYNLNWNVIIADETFEFEKRNELKNAKKQKGFRSAVIAFRRGSISLTMELACKHRQHGNKSRNVKNHRRSIFVVIYLIIFKGNAYKQYDFESERGFRFFWTLLKCSNIHPQNKWKQIKWKKKKKKSNWINKWSEMRPTWLQCGKQGDEENTVVKIQARICVYVYIDEHIHPAKKREEEKTFNKWQRYKREKWSNC